MKERIQSRVASGMVVCIGVWLLLSPRIFSVSGGALIDILVGGSAITLAGIIQMFWENTVPSWIIGFTALWLFIASVAFTMSHAAVMNEAITSMICFALATWDGIEIEEAHQHGHKAGV